MILQLIGANQLNITSKHFLIDVGQKKYFKKYLIQEITIKKK